MPDEYREITVAGVRLSYLEIAGPVRSDAPPLLLMHGLLTTAQSFAALMHHLPAGRRMVALDMLSAAPAKGGGLLNMGSEALAALVSSFIRSVALESPILIGHSYGGTLALRLAAEPGNDIRGLVLLCPAHPFLGYRSQMISFYRSRWGRFWALGIPLAPGWMLRRACNQATGTGGPLSRADLQPYLRVLRSRPSLRRVLQMVHSWEADMDQLREIMLRSPIPQPAVLIWGEEDAVVPLSSAAALQQQLPGSELVTLRRRGHLLADEAPEECARTIAEWLTRFEPRRPAQRAVLPGQLGASSPHSPEIHSRIATPRTSSLGAGD